MPLYVYQVVEPDGKGEIFEVLQDMSEPVLTHHPESGKPVVRLIHAPHVARKGSTASVGGNLSNANLERLGFSRYEKSGGGTYEKTAGRQGPIAISGK